MLPEASSAVKVRRFSPSNRPIPAAVQFSVPLAVPLPPRSLRQLTATTPTLSDAVPATVSVALSVA